MSKLVDVWPLPEPAGAERITLAVLLAQLDEATPRNIRPVFCPECRRHYTTVVVPGPHRAATCVHYVCAECGGGGLFASLAVPR